MTTLKSLVITLLIVVTMLTTVGWVLILSAGPTMGGELTALMDSARLRPLWPQIFLKISKRSRL